MLLPSKYTGGRAFFAVFGLYVLAKACEVYDQRIFAAGTLVSGHTLKHLLAAVGIYVVHLMLERRRLAGEGQLSVPSTSAAYEEFKR